MSSPESGLTAASDSLRVGSTARGQRCDPATQRRLASRTGPERAPETDGLAAFDKGAT